MFNILYKRKLLSTIIPVFNSSTYLEQCLESVCNQALDDHEIIVVNDGSSDQTEALLEQFETRHRRVRRSDPHHRAAADRHVGQRRDVAQHQFVGRDFRPVLLDGRVVRL